ncbi:archaeosortase A [Halomicrobium urmianum]|uniref:archaeosortase A n=1 Tax=Halomicrobium urmianum TaxID=1586233 RepID=UPI001CDA0DFE|nr:archaeosortase A [Halomicrobium urmianum]
MTAEGLTAAPLAIARPLSWIVVGAFLAAALLERRDEDRARGVAVGAWLLFGLFWLVLVPHFVLEQKSIVEGIGSVLAAPLSAYAGYRLWNGRDSLFVLTRAIGIMGLIYLPFAYVPFLEANPARRFLVETVAAQTHLLLNAIGVDPEMVRGVEYFGQDRGVDYTYRSTFVFPGNERPITYTIIVACTGIGSMAILGGAILAVRAPLRRKLRALAVSIPVIYGLNLVRNVFIATAFGQQRMQWFPGLVTSVFGTTDEQMVSYYIADRLLAQFGSVIALVAITWLVVRELPEVVTPIEDLLYLLTGSEYDLEGALGSSTVRADGGEE